MSLASRSRFMAATEFPAGFRAIIALLHTGNQFSVDQGVKEAAGRVGKTGNLLPRQVQGLPQSIRVVIGRIQIE